MMKLTNTFAQYHNDPVVLLEGGLYGHMSHVYEDMELSFYDLKDMIGRLLQGHIKSVKEKVDGQALAVSINDEGQVIFARNKGHIKNFGKNALDWKGVCETFDNRGDLTDAFCYASKDISDALSKLPKKSQELRFGEYDARLPKLGGQKLTIGDFEDLSKVSGQEMETVRIKRWLNFEIVWPETTNVVPYNHRLIILHNYDSFDIDGWKRDSDFNEFAERVSGELEELNGSIQNKFKITTMPVLSLPPVRDFENQRDQMLSRITTILSETRMNDANKLGEYYAARMRDIIEHAANSNGFDLNDDIITVLVNRWLFNQKKPNIRDVMNMIKSSAQQYDGVDQFQQWVKTTDTRDMLNKLLADVKKPIKDIVTDLGIAVMNNMKDFLTLDPTGASVDMKNAIEKVLQQVEATDDLEVTKKIDGYLASVHRAGGLDKIVPSEGLTFTYKPEHSETHSVYKLTGAFADINQIIGFFKYARN